MASTLTKYKKHHESLSGIRTYGMEKSPIKFMPKPGETDYTTAKSFKLLKSCIHTLPCFSRILSILTMVYLTYLPNKEPKPQKFTCVFKIRHFKIIHFIYLQFKNFVTVFYFLLMGCNKKNLERPVHWQRAALSSQFPYQSFSCLPYVNFAHRPHCQSQGHLNSTAPVFRSVCAMMV